MVSSVRNPYSDSGPMSFILGVIKRIFLEISILLERIGLPTFLRFLHHAVRNCEGMCNPSRLKITNVIQLAYRNLFLDSWNIVESNYCLFVPYVLVYYIAYR